MNRIFLAFALFLLALGTPLAIEAAVPFGGRVVSPPVRCDVGTFFVIRGTSYSGPMMWLPGTRSYLVNSGGPPRFGQCLLGSMIPGFVPCTVRGAPVGGGPSISPVIGFGSSAPGCLF